MTNTTTAQRFATETAGKLYTPDQAAALMRRFRAEMWQDEHYPRCLGCGLRTYVHTLSGARLTVVTDDSRCPEYLLPSDQRTPWPHNNTTHEVQSVDLGEGNES